jgi:sulfide:quinone oxidoreductase
MSSAPPTRLQPGAPRHVIVAGGGFAAVEALLALRALAGDRVSLELVAPDRYLRYRPSATGEAFGRDQVATFPLAGLAAEAGARFRRDALSAVAARDRRVRLASGATARYDALVLALGARRRTGIPGAVTFRDERDAHLVRDVVDAVSSGAVRRVAFAVPSGAAWPLPVYELALLTAAALQENGADAQLTVVTPERRPLDVFGPPATQAVEELLAQRGVGLVAGVQPRVAHRDRLELRFDGALRADRVIAVPRLEASRIGGVPGDWNGFVATDLAGRVASLPDVYAAGDMTSYPVKQGGLATQAADAAARDIAVRLGADVDRPPALRTLRARLAGPAEPLYLRAELDERGRPLDGATVEHELPWWPSGKVVGRYLGPHLARLASAV